MGTTYSAFEARIRQDLSDSGIPPLLATADLDRHVDHAARDISLVAPIDLLLPLTATAGSRVLDLTAAQSTNTILRYVAVEWPVGRYPQEYVQFNVFGATLTLLVEAVPSSADPVNLYARVAMVCGSNAAASTIPPQYDDIVSLGAAGYAAQELATRLMNAITVGGPVVWEHYLTLSTQLLADFALALRGLAARHQLFSRRLYTPEYPPQGVSQSLVYPPGQIVP